jgi:basic amino acid/polyamine antiporter, APA family
MSFQRALGLFDSTMIVAGSMIGSGIFIVSADIARTVGSPLLLLAVWVITGALTLTAALSYGELAGMFPQAGGQYVYLRESFGPMAGFLYGWTLFTVIQTGTIAAVAMAFAKYTAVFFSGVSDTNILFTLGPLKVHGAQVLAIISIVVLTAMNARGVRLGKLVQNVFTSTKIVSVVALALIGIVVGWGSDAFTINWSSSPQGIGKGRCGRRERRRCRSSLPSPWPWSDRSFRATRGTTSRSPPAKCATRRARSRVHCSWAYRS